MEATSCRFVSHMKLPDSSLQNLNHKSLMSCPQNRSFAFSHCQLYKRVQDLDRSSLVSFHGPTVKRTCTLRGSYLCDPFQRRNPAGQAFSSVGVNTYGEESATEYHSHVAEEKVGVLLLNLGGPETLQDVQPFLFNLFADPDIIRLPRPFRFLQRPLAQLISVLRAPKSREGYASIGGGSPLRKITDEQAQALQLALEAKKLPVNVYVGMRYWYPFTEEAVQQIKNDRITRLVVLPLYPQFSISTTGSSIRVLQNIFREDSYLSQMPVSYIRSWYQREGYIKSMADLIEKELMNFSKPEEVMVFFSAHGVPVSYVENAGDPYRDQMEECIYLIMQELKTRGVTNDHTLAYQSRVGPVEWLKPYTDKILVELGQKGVKSLLAIPVKNATLPPKPIKKTVCFPPFCTLNDTNNQRWMATAGDDLSQFNLSIEEKDKLVADVIRYILFKTNQSSGCPIKRDELTQLVTKNYNQRSLPALVINEAKKKLSSIFGYEMRELQRSRPSSTKQGRPSQQSVADAKSYVIISQLPPEVYRKYVEDVNSTHLTGFTFVVISIVHLAGGKIPEESLWHHLRRMGLCETDESHPVLGNIKQALEVLVQQRYLQKDKVNGPEGNTLMYELAERALDERVNERIKEYISQVVKKDVSTVEVD